MNNTEGMTKVYRKAENDRGTNDCMRKGFRPALHGKSVACFGLLEEDNS